MLWCFLLAVIGKILGTDWVVSHWVQMKVSGACTKWMNSPPVFSWCNNGYLFAVWFALGLQFFIGKNQLTIWSSSFLDVTDLYHFVIFQRTLHAGSLNIQMIPKIMQCKFIKKKKKRINQLYLWMENLKRMLKMGVLVPN